MPSPRPPASAAHYVLEGSMAGGERWAAGWWDTSAGSIGAQAAAEAVDTAPAFPAFRTAFSAFMSNTTTLERVRVTYYDSSRNVSDVGVAAVSDSANHGPDRGAYQVAVVVSLYSATMTRSGRNRMYLPATGVQMGSTGQFNGTLCQNLATAAASYLGASGALIASPSQNLLRPLTRVSVDTVPDTQRRRTDKLVGQRYAATPP